MEKDYFIIVIIAIAGIFVLFLIGVLNFYPVERVVQIDADNINDAVDLARQRVVNSHSYNLYEGENPELIQNSSRDCEMCWIIVYQYGVNEGKAPLNVESVEMRFDFESGRIVNTTYSEILRDSKIYCMPEQRNADVCIEIYEPVCGYFSEESGCEDSSCRKEYSNSCFACNDERVIYYEKGMC